MYDVVSRVTDKKIAQNVSEVITLVVKNTLLSHINAEKKSARTAQICSLIHLDALCVVGPMRLIMKTASFGQYTPKLKV